jgi:hypothetical protein
MKNRISTLLLALPFLFAPLSLDVAADNHGKVKKVCKSGVCGRAAYDGTNVNIYLSHKLSRATHYNFKTNPGDQIEISGRYSFPSGGGEGGTYSAQACNRGGIAGSGVGGRSTCTKWATFNWNSGAEDLDED